MTRFIAPSIQTSAPGVFGSITVPGPNSPYTPTAANGGGDFGAAVRIGSGLPWYDPTHPTFAVPADGTTDASTALAAFATVMLAVGRPVHVLIPPAQYALAGTTSFGLPEGSAVSAYGARFIASNDSTGFDLNPPATAAIPTATTAQTKRSITWQGGDFVNTNVTKTASTVFQAYMMRRLVVRDVWVGESAGGNGFYAFVKFAGLDTYRFIDCLSFGCTRHYWVPAAGTVYAAGTTANDLIDVELRGCQMSAAGADAGIYFENRVINFHMNGGSVNGAATIAHVRLSDNATAQSQGIWFNGAHFEQMGTNLPAVLFVATGAKGFIGVGFDGGTLFSSGTAGWQGVQLDTCQDVTLGSVMFIDGTGGKSHIGVQVDANSRRIRVAEQCRFSGFLRTTAITATANNGGGLVRITATAHGLATGQFVAITGTVGTVEANGVWIITVIDANTIDLVGSTFTNAWISGGTLMAYNAISLAAKSSRLFVTLEPQVCSSGGPAVSESARVLTNFNSTIYSTTADTATFIGSQLSTFTAFLLPPRAYFLNISVADSASAAAGTNTCWAKFRKVGDSTAGGIRAESQASANANLSFGAGWLIVDDNQAFNFSANATGAGTLTVRAECTEVRQ